MLSEEEKKYVREHIQGTYYSDLLEMLNREFNSNHSINELSNYIFRNKLSNGLANKPNKGCFKKGHVTWNAGTKGICKANKTSFKKGNIPKNYKPLGYERITKDGYKEIKISDTGESHKRWKCEHIIEWEKHHGPVPKGNKIVFLDGNRQNTNIDNLAMISYSECLILNRNRMLNGNSEIAKTAVNYAKLEYKINKLKRGKRNDKL